MSRRETISIADEALWPEHRLRNPLRRWIAWQCWHAGEDMPPPMVEWRWWCLRLAMMAIYWLSYRLEFLGKLAFRFAEKIIDPAYIRQDQRVGRRD